MSNPSEIEQAIRLIETADKDGALNKSDYSRIASLPGLVEHTRPIVDETLVGVANFPQEGMEELPIQKTILLVENDESVDRSTGEMLESVGHTVITAEDSIKALTLFDKNIDRIDMVVCDMEMRYMSGSELAQTLRLKKRVEAILMSRHQKEHFKKEEMSEYEFLMKPFTLSDFSSKVRNIFKKGKEDKDPVPYNGLDKPQIPIQNFVSPDHGDVGPKEQEGAERDRAFEADAFGNQSDDTENRPDAVG